MPMIEVATTCMVDTGAPRYEAARISTPEVSCDEKAVSYTHLTLPTSDLV